MTPLNKPIRRRSEELIRDGSKYRRVIVSVYPGGYIGLRMEKCRTEETISIKAAYEMAVRSRVAREKEEKRKAKGDKYTVRRGRL